MTSRYAPAVFVSMLLHAVVIAVVLWFSLSLRDEANVLSSLTNPIFVISDAAPRGEGAVAPVVVSIPTPPVREIVRDAVETPVTTTPHTVQPPTTKPRAKPAPPTAAPVTNQSITSTKPPRVAPKPPSTPAPPRVDTNWNFGPTSEVGSHMATAVDKGDSAQIAVEFDAYFAELLRQLRAELREPPGTSAEIVAKVKFLLAADGTLSRARIVTSSGSAEFDRAVLDAISRTRMKKPRPDGKTEWAEISFRTQSGTAH